MNNQQAFLRFKELLETRRVAHDQNLDIREHVLSLSEKKVGFGYVAKGLEKNFGANIRNIFKHALGVDETGIASADTHVLLGTIFQEPENSHKGGVRLLNAASLTSEILFGEAAFLATTHSWAHSFQQGNPAYACLGYVYDDIAHYFMADYPNRIIEKLNSSDTPSDVEIARATSLIERLVSQRISKYNAQPMVAPTMTDGYSRRVLVCDQAYADASTIYGKVGDAEFERMLLAAITENPNAEILIKTHPDTVWEKEKRTGYYAHLQSTGRVRVLRDPINPYVLFDLVDTVYIGTSQMGLEALLAGKKVVTFGAPFYAGWGLTDDRQKIPHRHRTRSLVEIFHYFYIWYTIYNLPGKKGPAEIEDVLDYIERNRPYPLPPSEAELVAPPKVSVIIPVHGVEKYIEECIASVQHQTLREIEIIPINDASPDGSQAIIDRLAAEDPRIKPIILRENIGQGFARNRGLDAARGDYVWLLDGDDWLPNPDMFRDLIDQTEQGCLDMVRSPKAFEAVFDENDKLLTKRRDTTEDYFKEPARKTDFAAARHILHNRHCWTWLYRRGFLDENDIRFVTPQWEERAFLLKALVRARGIGMTDVVGPAYRVRTNSTARRERGTRDFEMMLTNFRSTFDWFAEQGAIRRDHPLRHHLEFQLSQFVQHLVIAGPYRHYRNLGSQAEAEFIAKLLAEFVRCDFLPGDFVCDMHKLSQGHLQAYAYPLIVAAILAERSDILQIATDLSPVPQSQLYSLLLDPNGNADLQAALNRYARNNRVASIADVPGCAKASKPRIVIHIGATKTGSTFIQHMLEKNRPALLRQGIWFPEVGLFWQPTRPHKQAGHADFTRAAVRGEPELRDHIRRGLELMGDRIHTIVLSSEAFFLQENAHRLVDYFNGHPVEMVVYLRRQDEWANSQYCEFVAGGAVGRVDMPIEEWLRQSNVQKYLNYPRLLWKWREKIGLPNVHVRIFERSEFHGGDLLTDFAQTTGLPQLLDLPRPEAVEQNDARLSSGHVALLRLFNKRPFQSRNSYFNFIEEVGTAITAWRLDNGLPTPKPWILNAAQADTLMDQYSELNAKVARNYLKRSDGLLFGPRGAIPQTASLYPEEISLIEEIYQRHAPRDPDLKKEVAQETLIIDLKKEVATLSGRLSEVNEKSISRIPELEADRNELRERLARSQDKVAEIYASRSWRVTAPLRHIRTSLSRLTRRS